MALVRPRISSREGVFLPLRITCPGLVTAPARYPLPTVTGGAPPYTVSYAPRQGTVFPPGSTTLVTATVFSADGQMTNCTFPVFTPDPVVADFYVSLAGNDNWNGLAPDFPGGTTGPVFNLLRGMQLAQQAIGPTGGKRVAMRGGIYNQHIFNPPNVTGGTSDTNRITVVNYNGETVWLRPTTDTPSGKVITFVYGALGGLYRYIEFDGINFDARNIPNYAGVIGVHGGIVGVRDAHHIRFRNLESIGKFGGGGNIASFPVQSPTPPLGLCVGNQYINMNIHGGGRGRLDHGIYIAGDDYLIERCDIWDWVGCGIHDFQSSGNPTYRGIIRYNRIHGAIAGTDGGPYNHAAIIASTRDGLIHHNLLYDV